MRNTFLLARHVLRNTDLNVILFSDSDPVASEISDLCEIFHLLLISFFASYFASQNKEIKSGNYFFDVSCVN